MTIPYTFAGATTAIPLAQLDANFASPITLGNVAMTLSNTYTSIGNLTLNNVTINSGTINSAVSHTYGNANAVVFTNSSNVATTNTALTFDGNNLGIGTSSPASVGGGQTELTVKATGTDKYAILNLIGVRDVGGNQNGTIGFWNNFGTLTRTAAIIGQNTASSDTAGELAFLTKTSAGSLTEAMRITSAGAVGIGTSSPTGLFQVGALGDLYVDTTSTAAFVQVGRSSGTSGDNTNFRVYNRVGANAFTVNSGNKTVQVGTTLSVGDVTPATTGAGITFPATQSASSDANTLDDYEEGTWTPTALAGLTVVGTFFSAGNYTKIGRMVYLSGYVGGSVSVTASAGATFVGSLPFGAITNPQQPGVGIVGPTNAGGFILPYSTFIYAVSAFSTTTYFFNVAYQI